jgi:hypothetical protein
MHREAVFNNEYGHAEAQVNAQVERKRGLALASPVGVKNTKYA